jgi:hypothetical protein
MPESQVLTPGMTELELEFVRASEITPDGFRHAASGEAATLSSALWHCEDSLKTIYQPKIFRLQTRLTYEADWAAAKPAPTRRTAKVENIVNLMLSKDKLNDER